MANNQITPFQLTDQFTMDNFNQRIDETNTALQKKAPAGYGLGGNSRRLTADDNIDTIIANGWYYWEESNAPQGTLPTTLLGYARQIRVTNEGGTCCQEAVDTSDSDTHGCMLRRTIYDTTVYPWEWVNPPMTIGVEYRTTERYLGKPVYKRAVNIGDITGNGKSTFASNGATTVLSGELLYRGYLPFTYINGHDLNNSWTRYANVDKAGSNIEVSYFIGSSYGTSNNTVVILRYLKD